jgi:hypothetical protein
LNEPGGPLSPTAQTIAAPGLVGERLPEGPDPPPCRLGERAVGHLVQHMKASAVDPLNQPTDKQLVLFGAH